MDVVLHWLIKAGTIRRLTRPLYDYPNLFFVVGLVNPVGGMPMVVLCGQNVAKKVIALDK